ncbi:hypothetical protein TNCV_3538361 [Trichonephila clavipes]|nr:hypothetical protein TNCV_3538361 [Trichonephila clavipes]
MKRNDDDTGILEAASNLNYEADQDTRNPLPRCVPVELTPRTYKESTPGTSTEPTPEISKETFGTMTNSDPGSWPTSLSEAEIYFLVKEGLLQPLKEYSFPYKDNGRRFSALHYLRNMKNGEKVKRNWLVYSTTKD